ncbi:MAG: hypothetical protein RLZZ524_1186, partial [Pseudomonadota bacterium]
ILIAKAAIAGLPDVAKALADAYKKLRAGQEPTLEEVDAIVASARSVRQYEEEAVRKVAA